MKAKYVPCLLLSASMMANASSSCPQANESTAGCMGELGGYPLQRLNAWHGFRLKDLYRKVGHPKSLEGLSVPSTTASGVAEKRLRFTYPDFTIIATRASGQARYEVVSFTLRAASDELPCKVRFGEVISVPNIPPDGTELYWDRIWCVRGTTFAAHAGIRFRTLPDGRLNAIEWRYFAD